MILRYLQTKEPKISFRFFAKALKIYLRSGNLMRFQSKKINESFLLNYKLWLSFKKVVNIIIVWLSI